MDSSPLVVCRLDLPGLPKTAPTHPPGLIPLPDSDFFATATTYDDHTVVHVYHTTRRQLVKTRLLPFPSERIALLSPAEMLMVSLGPSGTLRLFGDQVTLPQPEGAVERSLVDSEDKRLSLFEDVFGRSAFRDPNEDRTALEVDRVVRKEGGRVDLGLLDGPSYLLPPFSTLYDSLMEGFLGRGDFVEEDTVEMDVDEGPEVAGLASGTPDRPPLPPRVVQDTEMAVLVDLFAQHATIGSSLPHVR